MSPLASWPRSWGYNRSLTVVLMERQRSWSRLFGLGLGLGGLIMVVYQGINTGGCRWQACCLPCWRWPA